MAKLTEDEILAYTLLGEAGGEGPEGMAAVMHVIANRAASDRYPKSLSSVALQKNKSGVYQFTTWSPKDGNAPDKKYSKDSESFKQALAVVQAVKSGSVPDPTGGALNYYANTGASGINQPWWFKGEAKAGSVQIGNHIYAAKTAVDERAKANYTQQLSAAMQGGAFPATMSNVTAMKRISGNIDYLPARKDALQLQNGAQPIEQTRSRGEAGAAARNLTSLGGGLVTRKVTTVPIDPMTGMPATQQVADAGRETLRAAIVRASNSRATPSPLVNAVPGAAVLSRPVAGRPSAGNGAANAERAGTPPPPGVYPGSDAYKRWEAQVVQSGGSPQYIPSTATPARMNATTTVVRKDGTTSTSAKPGSTALPASARPGVLPKLPVPGIRVPVAANKTSILAGSPQSFTTKLVTQTVRVKNPAYKPPAEATTPTGSGITAAERNAFADLTGTGLGVADKPAVVAPVVPEYIDKEITVEQRVPVLAKPSSGGSGGGGVATYVPPPPSTVKIATGKTATVGQTYQQGSSGSGQKYTYQVQKDGSIKNLTTGRTTAPATR